MNQDEIKHLAKELEPFFAKQIKEHINDKLDRVNNRVDNIERDVQTNTKMVQQHIEVNRRLEEVFNTKNMEIFASLAEAIAGARAIRPIILWFTILIISVGGAIAVVKGLWK